MTDDIAALIEGLRDRIRELEAERDKLQAEFAIAVKWHEQDEADYNELRDERDAWKEEHGNLLDDTANYISDSAIRAKTIEECAQIVQEDFDRPDMAEAIRALAHASTPFDKGSGAQQHESKTESGE